MSSARQSYSGAGGAMWPLGCKLSANMSCAQPDRWPHNSFPQSYEPDIQKIKSLLTNFLRQWMHLRSLCPRVTIGNHATNVWLHFCNRSDMKKTTLARLSPKEKTHHPLRPLARRDPMHLICWDRPSENRIEATSCGNRVKSKSNSWRATIRHRRLGRPTSSICERRSLGTQCNIWRHNFANKMQNSATKVKTVRNRNKNNTYLFWNCDVVEELIQKHSAAYPAEAMPWIKEVEM